MTSAQVELRAGAPVEMHALVLSSSPYQETDKLVRLLTLEAGRITAFAASAQRSVKRFGGALEPMTYVKAHLKAPRETQASEGTLWRLQSVDLRGTFEHWRQNYSAIDTSMFLLKMVLDFVPESHQDPLLFKTLGKFLRDSSQFNFPANAAWMRAYFWSWFTRHLGYGDLCEPWESEALDLPEDFWKLWWVSIEPSEPLVAEFLDFLAHQKLPPRTSLHETYLYEQWLALTGLHWDYFHKWLTNRP